MLPEGEELEREYRHAGGNLTVFPAMEDSPFSVANTEQLWQGLQQTYPDYAAVWHTIIHRQHAATTQFFRFALNIADNLA